MNSTSMSKQLLNLNLRYGLTLNSRARSMPPGCFGNTTNVSPYSTRNSPVQRFCSTYSQKLSSDSWRRNFQKELTLRKPPKCGVGLSHSSVVTVHTSSISQVPRGQNSGPGHADLTPISPRNVDRAAPEKPNDKRNPMSQKLLSARTLEEIVSVLENDAELLSFDTISISVALDCLFDAVRNGPKLSVMSKHQLLTSVGVQKLCKLFRRSAPHMDPGDLINGVKLLTKLSAPGNHLTLQVLLKLLSKHANMLDLHQLAYMQFLLDKMDTESKSPLSQALEYALPVVFESQLNSQLDRSDPQSICDYLHYVSKYKLSEKSANILVEAALKMTDRIPSKLALSVLWSLCDLRFENPSYEPLVTWCFRKLTEGIEEFKMIDLNTSISKAARKYSRASYFYNEDFLNSYFMKITQNALNVDETLWSIKYASMFKHVNIDHLDHIGEIIASNPTLILNNDRLFVIFMKAICNANYKPEKWASFSSILLEHPALMLSRNFSIREVALAVNFLALEMFPDNIINLLYSANGLPVLEEYQEKNHPILLLLLYNSVKVLYPDYRGPLPPTSMIESWKELARAANKNKQYPIKNALQTGLGGDSYVINGLYHDGLHIDHGIVMRKGGYPVAVNSQSDSQSDCLSNISKPAGSVIVLIKVFTNDLYANNTRRLRGTGALELRILENLGHPVVCVDLKKWMELADHEKIPFLMQRIRQKMEHFQWNQNWGDVVPP